MKLGSWRSIAEEVAIWKTYTSFNLIFFTGDLDWYSPQIPTEKISVFLHFSWGKTIAFIVAGVVQGSFVTSFFFGIFWQGIDKEMNVFRFVGFFRFRLRILEAFGLETLQKNLPKTHLKKYL